MEINKKYIDANLLLQRIKVQMTAFRTDNDIARRVYEFSHKDVMAIINATPPEDVIEPPPKKKQKVYIAGKMTGDNHYREKFADAHKALERIGYIVLDPSNNPAGMDYADYMTICFAMIAVADVVAFLPDWNESKGATLEHSYCEYIDKPIMNLLEY